MKKIKDYLSKEEYENFEKKFTPYMNFKFLLNLSFDEAKNMLKKEIAKQAQYIKYFKKREKEYFKEKAKTRKDFKCACKETKLFIQTLKSFKVTIETLERHNKINEKV